MLIVKIQNIDGASVVTCKPPLPKPPPGESREYRLVPVEELSPADGETIKDGVIAEQRARIAELEKQLAAKDAENGRLVQERRVWQKQLADRSPGVMPECVKKMVEAAESNRIISYCAEKALAKAVRDCYAPPDGHEWEPVDDANPITAADVGRRVLHRNGGSGPVESFSPPNSTRYPVIAEGFTFTSGGRYCDNERLDGIDITHILRPIAPPFVFDGKPGRYSTDFRGDVDVVNLGGTLRVMFDDGRWNLLAPDGTFAGGRITGRAEE